MKKFLAIIIVVFGMWILDSGLVQAQPPPPPPPQSTGAPIDNDTLILFIFSAAFGCWQILSGKFKLKQEE